MYSDGERKTMSELQREAEATRNQIVEEARNLERIKKSTAKTQFSIDQLFRFFAREVETEEQKKNLVDVLMGNLPDLHVECVPMLPISIALANGRLTNAQRIFAEDNALVDDSVLIFFVHVLRFSPQTAQIDYVDISGTHVTAKGLCFMLEMMVERRSAFTLVMRRLDPVGSGDPYADKFTELLDILKTKKHISIIQE
ncbi:hypothetical protein STCU_01707 [Strigomonas culicis]|uniref:Uncharacterized protein n=1 Tax=Strigomonas culicis TaxID=28005 RepID=S9UTL5_9TRYP|nr:hypothetical protein STCU_02954 [Strigomonas culicis]EPY34264.1 hypothetical protein STCU_01707 [Strigomonas culicis]|eukprot:EPY32144.1 hypothetical protein STCU_02954 [Strigomonas culicis]